MASLHPELTTACFTSPKLLLGDNLAFSSHSAVISAFGVQFAKTKRLPPQFHRYLIDAAQTRTEGDYSTARKITAGEAFEVISQAKEFIQFVDQL